MGALNTIQPLLLFYRSVENSNLRSQGHRCVVNNFCCNHFRTGSAVTFLVLGIFWIQDPLRC